MKKIMIYSVAFLALAFTFTEGFLATLKITKEQAQMAVWDSFSYGNYAGPAAPVYHNFAVPVQVAMVKEIGAFAKAYSLTDDFKKRYTEHREAQKPNPPSPYESTAAIRKKQHDALAANIKDIESKLNTYTGDIRKAMDEALKLLKEQLKQTDDPKNPMFSADMEAMLKKGYDDSMKEYQNKVAAWEKEYPVSPHDLIKQRLTGFLQLSATVDFNAKLTKGPDSKMIFVNEDYEGKDSDWKYIFRAGKPSTDAARAVATQWLAEIK